MYFPVQLDKMRNFRYGMKAISLIEKKLGGSISSVDMDKITMEELSVIVWAGLCHEDGGLTPDSVMDLIDDYSSVSEITKEMGAAIRGAFGTNEGADSPKKNAEAPPEIPGAMNTPMI